MNFAIIIPTRNEKINLEKLLPELIKLYPKCPVWIVDDNSADGTENFVKEFSQKNPLVQILVRYNKRGRGSAVLDGLKAAYKDTKISYFLEMDADLSHDPQDIRKLLEESLKTPRGWPDFAKATPGKQADIFGKKTMPIPSAVEGTPPMAKGSVIIGSRHIPGARFVNCSPFRMFLSKLANWYAGLILSIPKTVRHPRGSPQGFPWGGGNKITDYTNGLRLYPRNAVEILIKSRIRENGYIMLSETAFILYKKGFKFVEVPTIFVNRTEGKSNATIIEFLRSLPAIVRIRLDHSLLPL